MYGGFKRAGVYHIRAVAVSTGGLSLTHSLLYLMLRGPLALAQREIGERFNDSLQAPWRWFPTG